VNFWKEVGVGEKVKLV